MPEISASRNGPFLVDSPVPLSRRRPVSSDAGEPLAWHVDDPIETKDRYALCRCGRSGNKPFCDGTHAREGFEADDHDPGPYADTAEDYGTDQLVVRDRRDICVHAGFCGNEITNVWKAAPKADDGNTRAMVIGMVEKCPSGALTVEVMGENTEPLLPEAIGVVDDGPLFVSGGIPVELPDGSTIETRNRVTLCRCGASGSKPLCDGSHADVGFEDPT